MEKHYETTVSTIENKAQTAARVFEPQLDQERPGHPAKPSAGRTQAANTGVSCPMAAERPPDLRFGEAARLKTGRDFAVVRQEGERLVLGCLIANWRRLSAKSRPRLGVVTSRKIGNAVVRSRARRLLREAFRLHQHELAPIDLVLVGRPPIAGKSFAEVEQDFLTMLRKARLLKREE